MKKRLVVKLTLDERLRREGLIQRGWEAAFRRRHAEVLWLVDEGEPGPGLIDRVVAERTDFSRRPVERIRERCVTEGRDSARERKKRSRERSRRLDGEGEARLISLAGSKPPEGHTRWTLPRLADRLVEWEMVDSISHEWVRQVLNKTV